MRSLIKRRPLAGIVARLSGRLSISLTRRQPMPMGCFARWPVTWAADAQRCMTLPRPSVHIYHRNGMRFFSTILLFIFLSAMRLRQDAARHERCVPVFSVERAASGSIRLHWQMPPGYYLYREHLSANTADGAPVPLSTAPA
ncbi:hypothetical protein DdX_21531 [Ditylenchus destructor]|uniref:Uncharacterized protein n=1 Tax=Ditylenchus destructor TaxID=166010 RepID=A0AAD4MES8_9BILA|nr:hypothetical protein DdX_21531 [Ditylenchus destructor]